MGKVYGKAYLLLDPLFFFGKPQEWMEGKRESQVPIQQVEEFCSLFEWGKYHCCVLCMFGE